MLKCGRSSAQAKGHPTESKSTIRACERCLLLVFQSDGYLIVAGISVKKAIIRMAGKTIQHLIHKWKQKMILVRSFVQLPVINKYTPSGKSSRRYELVVLDEHTFVIVFSVFLSMFYLCFYYYYSVLSVMQGNFMCRSCFPCRYKKGINQSLICSI